MRHEFLFKLNDHLECVSGDNLVTNGNVYVAHSVSTPRQTLYQWLLVDVTPGRREWVPADRFKKL